MSTTKTTTKETGSSSDNPNAVILGTVVSAPFLLAGSFIELLEFVDRYKWLLIVCLLILMMATTLTLIGVGYVVYLFLAWILEVTGILAYLL